MTTAEFSNLTDITTPASRPDSSVGINAALAGIGACLLALVGTYAIARAILRHRRRSQLSPCVGDSGGRCCANVGSCLAEGVKNFFASNDCGLSANPGDDRDGVYGDGGQSVSQRTLDEESHVGSSSGGGFDEDDRFGRWQSASIDGWQRSVSSYSGLWTDDAAAAETTVEELGSLSFSLLYSHSEQTLAICVLGIAGLSLRNGERFEPYVKLLVLPMRYEAKTRVIRGTSDPEFDETFTLRCPNLEATVIQFTVCSFDRYSRDVVLGDVTCALADVEAPAGLETFLRNPIVSRFNQILLQQPGELLVSLSYQQLASRLVVTILKARNLPTVDSSSPLDTFVSICLLYKGQVIAVRATQVKAGDANPVYNETFLFDLPISEHLNKIAIIAKVCGCSSTMRCESIGWLEISDQTPVTSQHYHWQQTIAKPGRQVAQWHKLTHEYGRLSTSRSALSR